jgi:hypothetical protein
MRTGLPQRRMGLVYPTLLGLLAEEQEVQQNGDLTWVEELILNQQDEPYSQMQGAEIIKLLILSVVSVELSVEVSEG